MSAEENKVVVRRFIDSYNARNLDMFDELMASDYVDHTHHQQGRESLRRLFSLAFKAFPDWHEEIEDIVAQGDRVWVSVRATGTHTGEWYLSGVPLRPTGRKVVMRMVFIWRIVKGRLAEGWEVDSDREFLMNLGIIEYTEKGKKIFPNEAREGMAG
jgi:C-1 hydroxylase